MTWAIGAFYGDTDDDGDSNFDDVTNADLTMRLTGLPLYADEGKRLLHLGLSYSHQFRDEGETTARYRNRPESNLTDVRLVDTGNYRFGQCEFGQSGNCSRMGSVLSSGGILLDQAGRQGSRGSFISRGLPVRQLVYHRRTSTLPHLEGYIRPCQADQQLFSDGNRRTRCLGARPEMVLARSRRQGCPRRKGKQFYLRPQLVLESELPSHVQLHLCRCERQGAVHRHRTGL